MRPANPFAYCQICGSRRVRQIVSLEGIPQQPIAMRREDCFFAAPGFSSSIVAYLSVVTSNVCSSSVVARPSHNGGETAMRLSSRATAAVSAVVIGSSLLLAGLTACSTSSQGNGTVTLNVATVNNSQMVQME